MKGDILQVLTQGIRGTAPKVKVQARCRMSVTKGFNEPMNSIEVDTYSGLGPNYKHMETALINIKFADGYEWNGTFDQLALALKKSTL